MTAHFYCWDAVLDLDPAHSDFAARIGALHRDERPPPSPKLLDFVVALLARYGDLTETQDTVWGDGPLVGNIIGDFINMSLVWSRYVEAAPFIVETAHQHGLHCYDPQTGEFYSAASPLPPRELIPAPAAPGGPLVYFEHSAPLPPDTPRDPETWADFIASLHGMNGGMVRSAELAVKIAEVFCEAYHGTAELERQRPFAIEDKGDHWRVEGSWNRDHKVDGAGAFYTSIMKRDCRITDIGRWMHLTPHPSVRPFIEAAKNKKKEGKG